MVTRKTTPKKNKPQKANHNAQRKKQKKHKRSMPLWLRTMLIVLFSITFLSLFFYFFIRPYSYRWKPCYGLKAYNVCVPCCYEVHGIDISHHQDKIDWSLLSKNRTSEYPLEFIFMKATEGGDHTDRNFNENFESSLKNGFIRGAYHFFSPKTDPIKQANFFIQTVKLEKGDLPPVLDVEIIGKTSPDVLKENVKIWLEKVESHYGVKPIIYTSYKFKKSYLNDACFDDYPYWIAHYYVDSVRYNKKWSFWQHSDIGTVPGIKNDVDLNVFNGSLEDLYEFTIK